MSRLRWTGLGMLFLGLAVLIMANSCRSLGVSPLQPQAIVPQLPSGNPDITAFWLRDPRLRVPDITDIRAEVRGDSLHLSGKLDPIPSWFPTFYDPLHRGGWMMQIFVNSDQESTGYSWRGIDYLVRGGERLSAGSYLIRRVEPGSDETGGWGPVSGVARLITGARTFEAAVPRAAIEDENGQMDFVIETYATVECPECEHGVSHLFVEDYFGRVPPESAGLAAGFAATRILMGSRPLARTAGRYTGSDTDARW